MNDSLASAPRAAIGDQQALRLLAGVPLLLALLAHLPALWGELIWDDQIVRDDQLAWIGGLLDVLLPPANVPNWADNYYRPVVTLSYLVDFRWLYGATSTIGPHLSNLLFHVACAGFAWLLARQAFGSGSRGAWPSLVAASVFAVHPVHVESVNWIAGRSDLLATMLLLPALVLALRFRDALRSRDALRIGDSRSYLALAGSAVLFFLALLAKEVALAGLLLLPLAWWLLPGKQETAHTLTAGARPGRSALLAMAAWAVVAAVYLLLRQLSGTVYGAPMEFGPVVLVVGLGRAVAWYAIKSVVPWPQALLVPWSALPGLLESALALLVVGAATWLSFRHLRERGDGLPLFALCWVAVTLLPALWVALGAGTFAPVAERYLYLPSVGVALGAGWLLRGLLQQRRALALAVLAAIIGVYGATSLARGAVWQSDVALWEDQVRKTPREIFAWHSLARALRARGEPARALDAYEQGLLVGEDPGQRAKVLYGIAELQLERGDLDAAERVLERAQLETPAFTRPVFGLGLVALLRAERLPAGSGTERARLLAVAERQFRAALAATPDLHEARICMAQVYELRGDYTAALAELDRLGAALPARATTTWFRSAEPGVERDLPAFRKRLFLALATSAPE
jgi:tetratricopeptide (TPR) repeat protein